MSNCPTFERGNLRSPCDLVDLGVQRFPEVTAVQARRGKPAVTLTYRELAAEVKAVGCGLLAAGIEPGDKVALFSDNRPRWLVCDLAILSIGAVDVPRGADTSVSEFQFILQHSGAVAAFVQDKALWEKLKDQPEFKALKCIVLMDETSLDSEEDGRRVLGFRELINTGSDFHDRFDAARKAVKPDSLATIIYTSGTTGSPKGVMLTHLNLATQPNRVDMGYRPEAGEVQMCLLPSWHAYERATEYYGMRYGLTLTYTDKRYLKEDLKVMRPHLFPCVPRIWEAIYDGFHDKVRKQPARQQRVVQMALKVGTRYVHARRLANGLIVSLNGVGAASKLAGRARMAALYPAYQLANKLVFSKIRELTGGRMRVAVSGGGSLAPYLDDFFEMAGIEILNGYGLTETSPVLAVRRLGHNLRGSVGLPVDGTEIVVRSEEGQELSKGSTGVIHVRGEQVMEGYYQNPEATGKVLVDGWFNTGDLGYILPTGDLVISGRAKDTIVLLSGENVEPEPIEDACRKSPYITQIVVVGQDQKYVGALVVPNAVAVAEALGLPSDTSLEDICMNPDAIKLVKDSITSLMKENKSFKQSDQVTKLHLLCDAFSEENGLLTQTMKIRRLKVAEKHADIIAQMFN